MATMAQVQAAIRARLEANFLALPLRWKGETTPLPDTPAAHVLVEILVDGHSFVAYGGGRGGNLQRTEGVIAAHVMIPLAVTGVGTGYDHAEAICAVFRGFRDASDLYSCFSAEVIPIGQRSEDGNYDLNAT